MMKRIFQLPKKNWILMIALYLKLKNHLKENRKLKAHCYKNSKFNKTKKFVFQIE